MAEEQQSYEQEQEQSPSPPPSKVARLSDAAAGVVTMAAPSPLVLGLGLGVGAEDGKPAFTFMQIQELQHQALIYKYMAAGVPIPLNLVLPIWKSVAASGAAPHRYPTLMGWGSLCFDYRNSMEPEPGRCRRTDGKKWRCSRDVVPEQKYCERHMHRGRNRSRKPVEAGGDFHVGAGGTPTAVASATATATSLSISVPTGGGLGLQFLPGATNSKSNSSSSSSNCASPTRLGFSPSSVLHSVVPTKTRPS